jgi:hypothetical protein
MNRQLALQRDLAEFINRNRKFGACSSRNVPVPRSADFIHLKICDHAVLQGDVFGILVRQIQKIVSTALSRVLRLWPGWVISIFDLIRANRFAVHISTGAG